MDHPRRCGENRESLNYATRDIGSPPQVRGKQIRAVEVRLFERITPAGAGKTSSRFFCQVPCKDHPRRCGENMAELCRELHNWGSPPQVRGKPHVQASACRRGRITPAGAGKTLVHYLLGNGVKDHPRRCGENVIKVPIRNGSPGSPPQVRGKRRLHRSSRFGGGITPAGAGKTATITRKRDTGGGSPPQVRGKQLDNAICARYCGITPAGAGKTCR